MLVEIAVVICGRVRNERVPIQQVVVVDKAKVVTIFEMVTGRFDVCLFVANGSLSQVQLSFEAPFVVDFINHHYSYHLDVRKLSKDGAACNKDGLCSSESLFLLMFIFFW